MDKKEKITTVLDYLNHRMSVMNQVETDKVKKILEDDDITLKEVERIRCMLLSVRPLFREAIEEVEWYIDYVWSHS